MYRTIFALLAGTAALAGSSSNAKADFCDWRMRTACETACYVFIAPVINNDCDSVNAMVIDHAPAELPPPSPQLKCSRSDTGYACEAWPQSEDLDYVWSSGDGASAATTVLAPNPTQNFSCSGGNVTVTIVTPAGASSTASSTLPSCQ